MTTTETRAPIDMTANQWDCFHRGIVEVLADGHITDEHCWCAFEDPDMFGISGMRWTPEALPLRFGPEGLQ